MGLLKTTVTAVAAAEKIKKSVGPAAKEEKKTDKKSDGPVEEGQVVSD